MVLGAYFFLPFPTYLRAFSGPPPLFAFDVSGGTGFFINRQGDIITNRHVAKACRRITFSGFGFNAQVAHVDAYPRDPGLDLALLKTAVKPPAVLSIADGVWPTPEHGGYVDVKKVDSALLALGPAESGPAIMIGHDGFRTKPDVASVQLPLTATTTDKRNWLRVAGGFFMQGDSGSPLIYSSGKVAGVISDISATPGAKVSRDTDWARRDAEGYWTGDNAEFIPGPVVREFVTQVGANLADAISPNLSEAVVQIYCFHTWPHL